MQTYNAIRIHGYGDTSVFRMEAVSREALGPKDIRIAVHASAVNPVDAKIRSGSQRAVIPLRFPTTLGMDVSGVVSEVGSQVQGFALGDEVFASPSHRRMGCYSEEVVVRASECAKKPSNISHEQAAGLPLVGLTAYNALVDHCRVQPGHRVFIQAGAGGVGSFAIQLAKALGAEVYTTCSTRNLDLVRSFGADHAIDYTKARYEDVAQSCDAALEALGREHLDRTLRTLRRGGRMAAITMSLPYFTKRYGPRLGLVVMATDLLRRIASARLRHGVSLRPVTRRSEGETLAKIAAMVEAGQIHPLVDRVLPLPQVAEAHRYLESGRARGKVILRVEGAR